MAELGVLSSAWQIEGCLEYLVDVCVGRLSFSKGAAAAWLKEGSGIARSVCLSAPLPF